MKRMSTLILALSVSLLASGAAMAAPQSHDDRDHDLPDQHHDDRRDDRHDNPGPHRYARGEHLDKNHRGQYVDYRRHHLSAPPRGHQWRKVDNDYVLIAVATGIIGSVIAASQ